MKGDVWREYRSLEEDADAHVDVAKQALEQLELLLETARSTPASTPGVVAATAILHIATATTFALLSIGSRLEALTYAQRNHLETIERSIDDAGSNI